MSEKKEEKKKESNGLLLILLLLIVFLIIGVSFIGYLIYNKEISTNKNETKIIKEEKQKENIYFKTEIKDLILNVTNSKNREKLMKLSFSLKSTESTIEKIVEGVKDEIIDTVIEQISARSSEELLTLGGKDLLKEELKNEINIIINNSIKNKEKIERNNVKKIFFTTFVIN